jgi:hypothetical protein
MIAMMIDRANIARLIRKNSLTGSMPLMPLEIELALEGVVD